MRTAKIFRCSHRRKRADKEGLTVKKGKQRGLVGALTLPG